MQLKRRSFSLLALSVACGVIAFGSVVKGIAADKVDPTGNWTWTMQARNGGEARTITMKLKLEGEKVTGTITSPARQGGEARETKIEEGKLTGEDLSFKVVREFNNNKMTQEYTGKVTKDTIKGKIKSERNGEHQSRDWEAKRAVEKK
jgi:hypothetical protein